MNVRKHGRLGMGRITVKKTDVLKCESFVNLDMKDEVFISLKDETKFQ